MSALPAEWDLVCFVCHCRLLPRDPFLHQQALRLGRHLVDHHPYELRLIEVGVEQARRRLARDQAPPQPRRVAA